jgi:hypothetical protein
MAQMVEHSKYEALSLNSSTIPQINFIMQHFLSWFTKNNRNTRRGNQRSEEEDGGYINCFYMKNNFKVAFFLFFFSYKYKLKDFMSYFQQVANIYT